jgi:hypothetical protein
MVQPLINKKWYDNNVVVILLCFLIFPVGLYALWKSNNITNTWKFIGTVIVGAFVVYAISSEDEKINDKNLSAEENKKTEQALNENNKDKETENIQIETINDIQKKYISEKAELFSKQINSDVSADEITNQQNSCTKEFLASNNNKLINWQGKVIWVDMFKDTELDIAISLLERKIIGQKTISDRTMESGITIEAIQGTSKSRGYKGVIRNGALYDKIKILSAEDEIIFSAVVVDYSNKTEKTGLNLSSNFQINITEK